MGEQHCIARALVSIFSIPLCVLKNTVFYKFHLYAVIFWFSKVCEGKTSSCFSSDYQAKCLHVCILCVYTSKSAECLLPTFFSQIFLQYPLQLNNWSTRSKILFIQVTKQQNGGEGILFGQSSNISWSTCFFGAFIHIFTGLVDAVMRKLILFVSSVHSFHIQKKQQKQWCITQTQENDHKTCSPTTTFEDKRRQIYIYKKKTLQIYITYFKV